MQKWNKKRVKEEMMPSGDTTGRVKLSAEAFENVNGGFIYKVNDDVYDVIDDDDGHVVAKVTGTAVRMLMRWKGQIKKVLELKK